MVDPAAAKDYMSGLQLHTAGHAQSLQDRGQRRTVVVPAGDHLLRVGESKVFQAIGAFSRCRVLVRLQGGGLSLGGTAPPSAPAPGAGWAG